MVRVYHKIEFDSQKIAEFCQRHGVRKLSLFGSILREDFGPESDIDVLVEFGPEGSPSLLDLWGMLVELTQMLGRQVDLKTWGFPSEGVRREVERERQVLACCERAPAGSDRHPGDGVGALAGTGYIGR